MVITLDDGDTVEVPSDQVQDVYEQLWILVPQRGAVTAATKLRQGAMLARWSEKVVLDAHETGAFRAALQQTQQPRPR